MKKVITMLLLALFTSVSVAQWSEQSSGVTSTLYSVSAVDNNTVWICGAGGKILLTTNGGTNWVVTASPNSSLNLYNIWGINSTRALVTGSSSTTYVYRTTDAGATWTEVFTQSGGFINAIVNLFTPSVQYAMIGDPVAGRWSLWHSGNGGVSWDSIGLYIPQAGSETGYNNSAIDIGPNGGDYFWFGTNNSRVYRGYFGSNWISQPTPGQSNSFAFLFMDTLNGIIGGSTGIINTTNGGTNWSSLINIPGSGSINGFAKGFAYGEMFCSRGTSIYRTTNSGANWAVVNTQTGTYTHMIKARAATDYNIWAIRDNGGISKYTYSVGIKPISSEVPNSYLLYQNYPNPFNPTTNIRFQITKGSPIKSFGDDRVTLRIYDVLGKEIATLVNEQLQPGTYEVTFDGSNLPSGIYFYQLKSENFSDTKKLTLLK
jgi:photosystem II stability/assembly factor-like uncharacterized protein